MNLTLADVLWVAALVIAAAVWWHGQGIKSRAAGHARRYCQQHDLQWLDEALVLRRLWPARSQSGSLALERTYCFEFSSTGEYRYRGTVTMLGYYLKSIDAQAHHLQ